MNGWCIIMTNFILHLYKVYVSVSKSVQMFWEHDIKLVAKLQNSTLERNPVISKLRCSQNHLQHIFLFISVYN